MDRISERRKATYYQPLVYAWGDQFGFLLVSLSLILLPFERVILPSSLKPVDLVLVIIMGYGILRILISGQRIHFPLVLPFWLILIASLVATMGGSDKPASLIAISQEIYLYLWFLILVNMLVGFPLIYFDRFLRIWTLVAVAQAIFTILGMLTIGPEVFYISPENRILTSYTGLARGLGTFVNPNATGAYLSISFFLSLSTRWHKWLRYIFASILLAGMFGSGSLGALLSTFLGSMVFVLQINHWIQPQKPEQRRKLIILAVALIIFALFVLFFFILVAPNNPVAMDQKWIAMTLGRLPRSFNSRLKLIYQAWSAYKSNPLGIGPNASQILLGTVHNDYAAFLFERGPLGLAGWILLISSCLYFPLASARQVINHRVISTIFYLELSYFACAINAFTHEISHFRQFWMLMAFLFSLNYIANGRYSPLAING